MYVKKDSPHEDVNSRTRRLTICIDDFGLHKGVNRAALELAEKQRVSATSCLVDAPDWHEGRQMLKGAPGGFETGLHLNLTEPFGENQFHLPLKKLIVLSGLRLLDVKQLRQSIEQQLDRFESGLGRPPDFIDGHQHVHQLPVVRQQLIAACNRRYPDSKPWLRATSPLSGCRAFATPFTETIKTRFIALLGAKSLNRLATQHNYRHSLHLAGVYGFHLSDEAYLKRLRTWLPCCIDGDVLMCHPSLPWSSNDPIQAARETEYRVLGSQAFQELLETCGLSIGPLARP